MHKYSEDFERFWTAWPGRWRPEDRVYIKVGKYEASLEWKLLSKDDHRDIVRIVESGKVKRAGTIYLPDACRWLKRKRWHDFM